jgi:hypothetical protein
MPAESAAGEHDQRPVVLCASRDEQAREQLRSAMEPRYGHHYQVEVLDDPDDIGEALASATARGCRVALVLAGFGPGDDDGLDALASVGRSHGDPLRVAVVRWGDWHTAEPIFEAIALGRLDSWLTRPEVDPTRRSTARSPRCSSCGAHARGPGSTPSASSGRPGHRGATPCGTRSAATGSR